MATTATQAEVVAAVVNVVGVATGLETFSTSTPLLAAKAMGTENQVLHLHLHFTFTTHLHLGVLNTASTPTKMCIYTEHSTCSNTVVLLTGKSKIMQSKSMADK